MRQAGEVTYADAHKQRRNEGYVLFIQSNYLPNFESFTKFLCKCFFVFVFFSVVEFASLSDMKTAIEKLDDTELNGRRVRLVEDRRGRSGRGGRSRSSSRSSRSRSRSPRRRSRSSSRSKSRSRDRKSASKSRSRDRKSVSKSRSKSK